MHNRIIIIYCGLLLTLTAFSIDILLPAFASMAGDLDTSLYNVQLTVPFFLVAVGVGHLVCGSLSDRFGRRIIIKAGMSIYIAGSIAIMLAADIETVLAGRVLQGLGASAGPVIARAIIRDLYAGKELARNMALASAVFAFGPIVAPLAGAGLLVFFNWRVLLILMVVLSAILLAFCIYFLPETITKTDARATRLSTITSNIGEIFSHPSSRFYLLLSGITMSMILIILINIAAIYQVNFGITGIGFAILFAIQGVGIIIGQLINRRLINKIGTEMSSLIGSATLVIVSLAIVGLSLAGAMTPWLLTLLLTGHASGYLVVYANAAAMTLDPHHRIAGFTSSFYGFFSQVVSSTIGIITAIFIHGDLIVWSSFLALFSFITFVLLIWWRARASRP